MTQKYTSLSLEIIILQKRNLKARESRITVRSCNQLFLPLVLELRSPTSDFGPSFPTLPLRALMGTDLNGYFHVGLLHPCSYYDQVSLLKTQISSCNSLTHSLTSHPLSTGSNSNSSAGLLLSLKVIISGPQAELCSLPHPDLLMEGRTFCPEHSPPALTPCSLDSNLLFIFSGPLVFFRDYVRTIGLLQRLCLPRALILDQLGFPPPNSPCISPIFVLIILYCI